MSKLRIVGGQETGLAGEVKRRAEGNLIVKRRVSLQITAARDAQGQAVTVQVNEDDVVALQLEGGFKLWIRGDDFRKEFSGKTRRGAESGEWELSSELPLDGQARGIGTWILKVLEIFDVDLTGEVATKMAQHVESKLDEKPGLYAVNLGGGYGLNKPPAHLPADQPLLVFLHGTASSTSGSFGQLWSQDNSRVQELLKNRYGTNAFAFEHRTLTESPIQNTIELAGRLPENATVHLVSHSRGGLIGELLCRWPRAEGRDPFERSEIDLLLRGTKGKALKNAEALAKSFEELNDILKKKKIRVERFVRVACPSRGTTLASERLDRWLSVVMSLIEKIPALNKNPVYGALSDFLLAVVKERTDPKTMPGLEAMMPGSPIIGMLNLPGVKVDADLSVIAGDSEGAGIWSKLKHLMPDLFFGGDNDLVVNTGSMYGGSERTSGARFFLDQGGQVNHFSYFANERTVGMLTAGLTRPDGSQSGFTPIEKAHQEVPVRSARGSSGPRPVVFIVPGIMGSHLALRGDRIWLNPDRLAFGGFGKLSIEAADIEPQKLMHRTYSALVDYLHDTHTVITFPYDWRLSIQNAARELAESVGRELNTAEKSNQPVRILAHSMGGLVARAMIAKYPEVWQRICRHPGGRLVMLGTPNSGSYEIVRLIVGQAETLHSLSLLDITNSTRELLEIISNYPGILEMLPEDSSRDFFSEAFWNGLKADDVRRDSWVLPETKRLAQAGKCRKDIAGSLSDTERILYVAGCAPATPCGYRIADGGDGKKVIEFLATARGDGRVPWDTGIPPGVKAWYMEDAVHGDLAAHEPAFPGILELLQSGRTSRISTAQPAAARGIEATFRMPSAPVPMVPDEDALAAVAMGSRRRGKAKVSAPRIKVSVTHGNLGYARYPVAVGHYEGDTIVGAEKYLNRALENRLADHHRFGLYPGPLGSNAVFVNPDPFGKPGGAIIVGLGRVGELSPAGLSGSFARALSAFVLEVSGSSDERFGAKSGGPRSARITALLIGTGAGGISVEESVNAILRGTLKVSELLQESDLDKRVILDEVEFVELWQDIALQAGKALEKAKDEPDLRGRFDCDLIVKESTGGLQRINWDEDPEWWHRLQILSDENGALRFNSITGRARTEVSLLPTQRTLVDRFVEEAVTTTANSSETAKTLFELLLPNRLKEQAANRLKMVLLLDRDSARYPWELLEDRLSGATRPLAVESGVLRQLETQEKEFRERGHMATDDAIYVVGDPVSNFVPLPGAEAEARLVADQFANAGFKVEQRIRSDAMSIVTALHAKAYRILHLAGHGVHEEVLNNSKLLACEVCGQPMQAGRPEKISGMIIGQNIFLTPADVEQVRQVPELVFINCCHLGRTDSGAQNLSPEDRRRLTADRHKLAANVAAQFIRMGVKAVIAAGWAVDDSAAKTFAHKFYDAMLNGCLFGEAVRMARDEAYQNHRGVNTWGAYQCYGDPDYRLRISDRQGARGSSPKPFVSPAEMAVELSNFCSRAQSAERDRSPELKEELDRIVERGEKSWPAQAGVAAALGLAYGELGAFKMAVKHLDAALKANKAELTVQAVEQRANYKCKWAVEIAQTGKKDPDAPDPKELMREAIKDLEAVYSFGSTGERLSLLGSAYKRLAILSKGEERIKALASMEKYYKAAHDLAYNSGNGKVDSYPLLNWLTAQIIGQRYSRKGRESLSKKLLSDADMWCAMAEAAAAEKDQIEPDIWSSLAKSDALLVRALAQGNLKEVSEEIVAGYSRARVRGASPRQFGSVIEHLDFIVRMYAEAPQKIRLRAERDALQELKEKLELIGGEEGMPDN